MQKIDLAVWPRAELFRFFSAVSQPFYSVTFRVDVTNLHAYARAHGVSFYYALGYLVTDAVNAVENFRYTIRSGEVWLLDERVPSFTDLKPGSELFQIVTVEAGEDAADFCRRAKALDNLCPHFHLSLQSGCDATLKRMNRRYDTARFYESVRLLNEYFDRPAVTTDLITGFPGETEEEFTQTLAFIEKCGFAAMHIFPYSIRPGTKAAAMEQVPPAVKEARAAQAAQVAEELHRAYLNGCVGQVYPVLFEQVKDGLSTGHAPNYMEVAVEGDNLHNVVRNVKITGVENDILRWEFT